MDGTADTYIEAVQTSFNALEMHIPDADLNILGSISNTMSDRCMTNRAIEQKLQNIADKSFNNYKCGNMHPLNTMGKQCDKVHGKENDIDSLKEKGKYPYTHRSKYLTESTVSLTTKLFHDTQYNIAEELKCHF